MYVNLLAMIVAFEHEYSFIERGVYDRSMFDYVAILDVLFINIINIYVRSFRNTICTGFDLNLNKVFCNMSNFSHVANYVIYSNTY